MNIPHTPMPRSAAEQTFTRQQFLIYRALMQERVPLDVAIEAVASWAVEHPCVRMDEEMTWAQWERLSG